MADGRIGRSTGRPPRLDRTTIGLSGITLADERGLAAVTMRRIAARLDSSPAALYRHVDGRDDLVELMVDLVIGQSPDREVTGNWRDDLERFVGDLLQLHRSHPWLASAPIPRVVGPQTTRMLETLLEILAAHPADRGRKLAAVAVMMNLVAGFSRWGPAVTEVSTSLTPVHEPPGLGDLEAVAVVVDAVGGVLSPDR